MLVSLKEPMGYCEIEGRRLYGRHFAYGSMGPTNVTRKFFLKYRDILKEEPITDSWLTEKTGKKCRSISFTQTDICRITQEELLYLAYYLGVPYIKPNRKLNKLERRWLRKAIFDRINKL